RKRNLAPVIMITGQGDESTAVRALKSGASDYVVKTAEFFRLLPGVIKKVLRERGLEDSLEISYRFVEAANRSMEISGLVKDFSRIAKRFTGCSLVEIRIFEEGAPLDCAGCQFHRAAQPLALDAGLERQTCFYTSGASGKGSSFLPFSTQTGSVYTNSMTADLSKTLQEMSNGGCTLTEYQSLALVPVRLADSILGMVYIADGKKEMLSSLVVEVLERAAMELGTAVKRLRAVAELERAREQLEERVRERTAELALANEKLRKEVEERSRAQQALAKSAQDLKLFAYSVMHDLKSPTVAIYGLTRLFHKQYGDKVDEKGKKYCEQIMRASEYCSDLIGQINDFIASKQAPLRREPALLSALLKTVREEFSERLLKRSIRFVEPETDVEIVVDRVAMTRLFTNLVDNALKYGGDKLSEIKIGHEESEGFCTILVGNDGAAMKKDECAPIFGAFQRTQSSSGIPGAGLGLNIVKEIAQRHGGQVEVQPGESKGVVFRVTIAKQKSCFAGHCESTQSAVNGAPCRTGA
ncbi:MAG: ATP-binding protein, partial [Syntrophobacteraceae bacterium]